MPDRSSFRHDRADDSPGFLLWKLTALWQTRLGQVFGDLGMTQTQYAILASLRWFEEHAEPPTQAHLVEHANIEKMTLSKAIRKLEDEGLLVREPSREDNRAVSVHFTAKGRRLIERAIVAVEDADDEFFGILPRRDLADYKMLAQRIIAANDRVHT